MVEEGVTQGAGRDDSSVGCGYGLVWCNGVMAGTYLADDAARPHRVGA